MAKNDMTGKTCIVTGGNSGIGRATAHGLLEQGARVVIVSRTKSRGETAVAELKETTGSDSIELVVADFGKLADVRRAAEELLEACPKIDVLINNAGLWMTERKLTEDGYETTFQVNHLAPFLLTNLLLERIRESEPARIVNVSSKLHHQGHIDFDDLQSERGFGKLAAYSNSKLANVLFTRELAKRLDDVNVKTNALHPGVVNTGLSSRATGIIGFVMKATRPFLITPEKGARTSLHVATHTEGGEVAGRYFDTSKLAKMSKEAGDDQVAARLWEVSEKLVGLSDAETTKPAPAEAGA